CARRLVVDYW
nr:immunoglobulin heavy chain junction region [Mus musculus]